MIFPARCVCTATPRADSKHFSTSAWYLWILWPTWYPMVNQHSWGLLWWFNGDFIVFIGIGIIMGLSWRSDELYPLLLWHSHSYVKPPCLGKSSINGSSSTATLVYWRVSYGDGQMGASRMTSSNRAAIKRDVLNPEWCARSLAKDVWQLYYLYIESRPYRPIYSWGPWYTQYNTPQKVNRWSQKGHRHWLFSYTKPLSVRFSTLTIYCEKNTKMYCWLKLNYHVSFLMVRLFF
jgi:hypothetical protein